MQNQTTFMKWLGTVRDLEGNLFMHNQTIQKLNSELMSIDEEDGTHRPVAMINKETPNYIPYVVGIVICVIVFFIAGALVEVELIKILADWLLNIVRWISVIIGVLCVIGLIVSIKGTKDHNAHARIQNAEIQKQNDEIQKQNEIQRRKTIRKKALIQEEIDLLYDHKNAISALLDSYYEKNWLHHDYRGLIPVCTIYQYFDSGRCSELTGPYGAYNLYADESYKKLIVSKLDVIISQLDSIRQSQAELYRVMSSCQRQISQLTDATNNMSEGLQSIQQNSAVIAYNTNYLREMESYRIILHGL